MNAAVKIKNNRKHLSQRAHIQYIDSHFLFNMMFHPYSQILWGRKFEFSLGALSSNMLENDGQIYSWKYKCHVQPQSISIPKRIGCIYESAIKNLFLLAGLRSTRNPLVWSILFLFAPHIPIYTKSHSTHTIYTNDDYFVISPCTRM